MSAELPTLLFASQRKWADWLDRYHASSPGIWMRLAKKNGSAISVTYAEALEEALCYGWIDGQKKSGDADTWLQRFTPRRPKSIWSKINCEKAAALEKAKRLHAAGQLQIDRARADGRWDAAYDPQSTVQVPEDFATLLAANPRAANFFTTLNSLNRYAILHRLQRATKPHIRMERLQRFVKMLAAHELIYPIGPITTVHRKK